MDRSSRDFGVGALWGGVLMRYYGNMDLPMPKLTNFVFRFDHRQFLLLVEILQVYLVLK